MFISNSLFSQITVTDSDLMIVGDEFYQGKDDSPSIILGSPGGNKTWNFSFLNAIDQDTISIVSPSTTPYASSYPNADLCMIEQEDGWAGPTTNYTYMTKNSSGLYILGENDVVLPTQSMFVPFPLLLDQLMLMVLQPLMTNILWMAIRLVFSRYFSSFIYRVVHVIPLIQH